MFNTLLNFQFSQTYFKVGMANFDISYGKFMCKDQRHFQDMIKTEIKGVLQPENQNDYIFL